MISGPPVVLAFVDEASGALCRVRIHLLAVAIEQLQDALAREQAELTERGAS